MAEKVKLSKDGHSIDFVQTDNIPTSMKKFRQSPEIEGFYRFIFENDLQKEAFEILERIVNQRKVAKKALKQEAAITKKLEQTQAKEQQKELVKIQQQNKIISQKVTKIIASSTKSVTPKVSSKTTPKANTKVIDKVIAKKVNVTQKAKSKKK